MYKRIMVAVDGSATAEGALNHAIVLAKEHKAQLAIVHVIDLVIHYGAGGLLGGYIQATRDFSNQIVAHARGVAQAAGIEAEILVPEIVTTGYHVAQPIAEMAREWKADLLVAGTHGRRGVDRFFMGSVAERIVRVAPCPLLLLRDSERHEAGGTGKPPTRP